MRLSNLLQITQLERGGAVKRWQSKVHMLNYYALSLYLLVILLKHMLNTPDEKLNENSLWTIYGFILTSRQRNAN